MTYIGLDLSLTGTGVCIIKDDVVKTLTIKTKPDQFNNDLDRIIYITNEISKLIPDNTDMICIEDFFTGPNKGAAVKIAMLGTAVRLMIYNRKLPFFIVAPTSLKKFILGKGVGQKNLIICAVFKKYNLTVANDNEADGACLAFLSRQIYNKLNKISVQLLKPEQEVVDSLFDHKSERGYNI